MIDYAGNKICVRGCLGCSYARHEFCLPSGMVYEDELFTMSQDWELPINGFMVIAPKRHIEKMYELTEIERVKIFEIVNKTIITLRNYKICDAFNVIFEEKEGVHFHIWIMPRHAWMKEKCKSAINNIGEVFDYAKKNLRTVENIKHISEICDILKGEI